MAVECGEDALENKTAESPPIRHPARRPPKIQSRLYDYELGSHQRLSPIKNMTEALERLQVILMGGFCKKRELAFMNRKLDELNVNMEKKRKCHNEKKTLDSTVKSSISEAENFFFFHLLNKQLQFSFIQLYYIISYLCYFCCFLFSFR